MSQQIPENVETRKIWDIALRLFHWALVICVAGAWGLGEFGPDVMTLHFYFGYAVIALLVFRVIWGLVGPAPARFTHFIYGPAAVLRYAKTLFHRKPSYWPGHNPLGALAVFAILGALILQVSSGLFADPDDYVNVGPLAYLTDSEGTRLASFLHEVASKLILVLAILHVVMIGFYKRIKGENLVKPMITGWKLVRKDRP